MHVSFSSAALVRNIFRSDVYVTTWPRELAERLWRSCRIYSDHYAIKGLITVAKIRLRQGVIVSRVRRQLLYTNDVSACLSASSDTRRATEEV